MPVTWSEAIDRRYAPEPPAACEARGYLGLPLEVSQGETPITFARAGSLSPGTVPSTVVSTRLAVGVPMLLNSGKLAALRVLA